jgi:hypothetical protein
MMNKTQLFGATTVIAALEIAALLSAAGCMTVDVPTMVPTAQSIASLERAGTVTVTETDVGGVGASKGVLIYRGKKYPFKLISVIGPGGASRIEAAGEVYRLDDIAEFPGRYAQGSGAAGLEASGAAELWLENKAGVVMHLSGMRSGVTLSLGRDEVIIEMAR